MSERNDQAALVHYVCTAYSARPDFVRRMFFHVPNGVKLGARNAPAMMAALKAQGVLPGVADLLYLQPRGQWAFYALELKTEDRRNEKHGGLSPDQQEWLRDASMAGGCVDVCYGLDEAIEAFDQYMRLPLRIILQS